ncbi:putative ABC transporter substrate-binding lipoprotein YhfQ precursor [Microbacterium hydrocarbonoxydans]|uniref:Putative ABC transporter substrate-binding lipoprotein YhfQ n=1 Tax=Microbacterium hydrocarbonoxydans TaxID=273678 RepID=A0A0M2HP21_9MICO|nr:ABC transporter substrate-binding protein [Microbacterium hydrocarbonoxydans]KJL48451.1 putative ABC transporter substrate-binding lipoprotein YhfQ precursor [Microbacterium hydrocarbonoxydans]
MRISRVLAAGAAAALALSLTACATSSDGSSTAGDTAGDSAEGGFPVTVEHAFGETTIAEKPTRVTTIGWGNQDVALALGYAPVGVDDQTWSMDGSDGLGVYDWTLDGYAALDAEKPVVFATADGTDFEAIADTQPDIILAGYSGLTEEDYATLSEIAPTIAFPADSAAWLTPWRDVIRIDSAGLGKADEGEELVASLDEQIAAATADSAFAGKTAAFFYMSAADLSTISIYGEGDSRTAFLGDLGFDIPEVAKGADTFYADITAENADQLADVDVIVAYGEGDELLAALRADPLWSTLDAVKNGAVVTVGSGDALSGAVTPTALSIPWMLDEYVGLLNVAAAAAK